MKIWYSTTSPFARKALCVIAYHALNVERLKTGAAFDAQSAHNQDNPLGRIPALQQDNGEWLFGSGLICEFLDAQGSKPTLFPKDNNRWNVLNLHSLADGILENTTPMLAEKFFRPEELWWKERHQQCTERNLRSFSALEKALIPFGKQLNIGTISALCLIDWWQFRQEKLGVDLTKNFPNLTTWAKEMNATYPELAENLPRV